MRFLAFLLRRIVGIAAVMIGVSVITFAISHVIPADPAVADANEAKGWDRYLVVREDDGTERLMSYEVIDSLEDAMAAISPRGPGKGLASLDPIEPPAIAPS